MFGIGLPEMIVILAVALIVVGPDKLPDLARSVAKGVLELKKTINQVKDSLQDEDSLIGSVQSELRKTTEDLKTDLIESDHFTFHEPRKSGNGYPPDGETVETVDLTPEQDSAGSGGGDNPAVEDPKAGPEDALPAAEGTPGGDPAPPKS